MTLSTGERIYRACSRCRSRKVKCDLKSIGENGKPPCVKCYNEGLECVLAGSRRGGDYTHYRTARAGGTPKPRTRKKVPEANRLTGQGTPRVENSNVPPSQSNTSSSGLQNPLEALELLAKVASKDNEEQRDLNTNKTSPNETQIGEKSGTDSQDTTVHGGSQAGSTPKATGLEFLDPRALGPLLERYHDTYHAFMPIVPRHILSIRSIDKTAAEEPFILTAVLLIATKDKPEYAALHDRLWDSMQRMLLQIVLGSMEARTVGCVEGLLVLAEWVPHATSSHMNVSEKGTGGLAGTEDTAAWTLIGLAVRQAYLLHLDKYAFRSESADECNATLHRKRLAWTYTYIADRQISIRMGQAFWCRGPSLSAKFTASDFPTLAPHTAYEDDYASVLQAQMELTVLFGNIHDLLYASKARSISLMVMGDYTKYLDDSMQGLAAWKQAWVHLDVGQHLKLILDLQYEYTRLYIHGFAFQAAISRAPGTPPNSSQEKPVSKFPHGILATPDGRHIHLSISAAKSVLRMLGDRINPTKHLRFLGPRFYLYAIHCAVFLYKASSYGALNAEEHKECAEIIKRYTNNLGAAASCEKHIAARHSSLLSTLWLEKEAGTNEQPAQSAVHGGIEPNQEGSVPMEVAQQDNAPDPSFIDPGYLAQQYNSNHSHYGSRGISMIPESFVTGLYGTQMDIADPFSILDFGAYGEPDLRSLITM
ncbi:hypothetical protein BU24DRAFT_487891 [Aaosphaeria arxii CBS 175.79]|uniref:Zn(2)-C6 fungal-type domain-containing protein n=1 Tax=Aaosphaeria arxii CBS 175.79 TaxID=1450172 RepID=A0A6A5Y836_9PLEO|nr:uncharacterized protein BU24DRAFT_487891 [Aaosphaeria arxii CBS 175.79]KAF2021479.1 hypothetical protein BU24DRAFT_487891 [Aaosphaeria arxii CBS 175.79]